MAVAVQSLRSFELWHQVEFSLACFWQDARLTPWGRLVAWGCHDACHAERRS
jgi:hypothetical protein